MKHAPPTPLLPYSSCTSASRTELVDALHQAAQIDPGKLKNLTRPQHVVHDLATSLETRCQKTGALRYSGVQSLRDSDGREIHGSVRPVAAPA